MTSKDRQQLLEAARHLEAIVGSLDRIGSTYGTDSEGLQTALTSYIVREHVAQRLAEARRALFMLLSDGETGVEADERLAAELGKIDYWTAPGSSDDDPR